jgi:hypothetical protein
MGDMDVQVTIVSAGRPEAVPRMNELLRDTHRWFGQDPCWVVPEDQAGDYQYAGASRTLAVHVPEGRMALPVQRNAALDFARDQGEAWCVQLNDDLLSNRRFPTGINLLSGDGQDEQPVTPEAAIRFLLDSVRSHGLLFGGIATTTNRYFYRTQFSTTSFVMAHLMAFAPNVVERFDEDMGVKEDYDMCMQHLSAHGGVLRCNQLLGNFRHNERDRRGGCSPYRTLAYEQMMADRLVERWGPQVIHNKRRQGEVLIRWKGVGRAPS